MPQVFLFTGENRYLLLQEKKRWIQGFSEKHGAENMLNLDARQIVLRTLLDEVGTAPFLSEKRLIVIDGIPRLEKEQVEVLLNEIHPQVILLFVEASPDKRLSSVKILMKEAETKTFEPMSKEKLLQWMMAFAKEQKGTLDTKSALHLLDAVGEDQALLAQEITKLVIYAEDGVIHVQDIENLVISSVEQAGWQLMDMIAAGKPDEAVLFAKKILERGENAQALWNMLLWMVGSLLTVICAVKEGMSQPAAITKATGVSFPAARTLLPFARTLSLERAQEIADRFAAADIDMKTGKLRGTSEAPEEIEALIDQCLYSLSR